MNILAPLALDTATRHPTLALYDAEEGVIAERQWQSEHRHGEQLLQQLDELLSAVSATPSDLGGIVAGSARRISRSRTIAPNARAVDRLQRELRLPDESP